MIKSDKLNMIDSEMYYKNNQLSEIKEENTYYELSHFSKSKNPSIFADKISFNSDNKNILL